MFYFALLWLRLLTLPPEPASRAGAAMVGRPDLADELPLCDCRLLVDRTYYLPLDDRSWYACFVARAV